ncbi:hypothetical protein HB820_06585 [Listeria booriae]|nr:hypothetical protein [Listeria booriae]MBC1334960.1 hypothetical protein [Listeria booriae]
MREVMRNVSVAEPLRTRHPNLDEPPLTNSQVYVGCGSVRRTGIKD